MVCRNIWFVWLNEAIYISWFYLPIQAFTAFMHNRNSVLSIQSIHYTSLSFFHHNLIEQVHLGCVLWRDSCHGRGSGSIRVWRQNWVRMHTTWYAGTLYHNIYVCAVILNPFGCWLSYYTYSRYTRRRTKFREAYVCTTIATHCGFLQTYVWSPHYMVAWTIS